MAWSNILKVPRPTKFLHFMSLRTGTSLILLVQIINKVTAFYGILALFTSYPLSTLQLSMYIYSLPILVATLALAGPLRTQSPWHCLAFAYLYTLDSIINALYTAFFCLAWFLVLSSTASDGQSNAPGAALMESAAGFTDPELNVSVVEIIAAPAAGVAAAQDAVAMAPVAASPATLGAGFAEVMLNGSSAMSLFVITSFWLLRFYAVFVVLAYARAVLRHHVQVTTLGDFENIYSKGSLAGDPFAEGTPAGAGLKGRLGRMMINIGREYWLGRDHYGYDVILKPVSGSTKFRKSEDTGVVERERRRRSGTGPPVPPPGLVAPKS